MSVLSVEYDRLTAMIVDIDASISAIIAKGQAGLIDYTIGGRKIVKSTSLKELREMRKTVFDSRLALTSQMEPVAEELIFDDSIR